VLIKEQKRLNSWVAFKQHGPTAKELYDHLEEKNYNIGFDHEHLILEPYSLCLLEQR
jgi:amylosucrase